MNRDAIWKRWRAGTPMAELARLEGKSISAIEAIIRQKLISRDAKRRRRPTVRRKLKHLKRGAVKQ